MPKIISLINQKGGVGKTTSAVNIASYLGEKNKVLLIDLDPQGNATSNCKIVKSELKKTIKDLLLNEDILASECIVETEKTFNLIGSNLEVADTEINLFNKFSREMVLREKIKELDYDYIIIDCSPSLSLLTINALIASDLALTPMEAHLFAIEGIESLLKTIKTIKRANKELNHKFFITKFDARMKSFKELDKKLRAVLSEDILESKIRVDNSLRNAQNQHQTIFEYDTKSRSAQDYKDLIAEVLL